MCVINVDCSNSIGDDGTTSDEVCCLFLPVGIMHLALVAGSFAMRTSMPINSSVIAVLTANQCCLAFLAVFVVHCLFSSYLVLWASPKEGLR